MSCPDHWEGIVAGLGNLDDQLDLLGLAILLRGENERTAPPTYREQALTNLLWDRANVRHSLDEQVGQLRQKDEHAPNLP